VHPARLTVVTLGVRDLPRLREFYVGLGWKPAVDIEGDFAAFELRGAVLALYPLDELAADADMDANAPERGLRGFSLAINVDQIEQVDKVIEAARATGARIAREPHTAEWGGRSGYFLDPEDNAWEVAWVPQENVMAGLLRAAIAAD
jgi:catechol 2,3-dioxygenase-like lactoylglutathione lyase family enzyme